MLGYNPLEFKYALAHRSSFLQPGCFRGLVSLLLRLLLRGKLIPLLARLLLLLSLLSSDTCEFSLGCIKDALTTRVCFRSVLRGDKLYSINLGLCLGPCAMHLGLSRVLYMVKSLRGFRYDASDHLWVVLYSDGLLQEILLQVLMNVRLRMLLYIVLDICTSIYLHLYSDVLPVSLEHRNLMNGTPGRSKASGGTLWFNACLRHVSVSGKNFPSSFCS